jgi:hypothetical protein
MTPPEVYRPVLEWFKERMDKKLAVPKNVNKGHWSNDSIWHLFTRVGIEVTELRLAIVAVDNDPERIIDECADVANFAMMIADNTRRNMK